MFGPLVAWVVVGPLVAVIHILAHFHPYRPDVPFSQPYAPGAVRTHPPVGYSPLVVVAVVVVVGRGLHMLIAPAGVLYHLVVVAVFVVSGGLYSSPVEVYSSGGLYSSYLVGR